MEANAFDESEFYLVEHEDLDLDARPAAPECEPERSVPEAGGGDESEMISAFLDMEEEEALEEEEAESFLDEDAPTVACNHSAHEPRDFAPEKVKRGNPHLHLIVLLVVGLARLAIEVGVRRSAPLRAHESGPHVKSACSPVPFPSSSLLSLISRPRPSLRARRPCTRWSPRRRRRWGHSRRHPRVRRRQSWCRRLTRTTHPPSG